ncbi:MAG TPA: 50S ribosomal protein L21 [Fervidobacterium sp.]|nr:50S ribosomal protein L21 [Fervidobacterium sp.]
MYAIVESGGKQYKVEVGELLHTEKMNGVSEGETITLEKVIMVKTDDGKTLIGHPYLTNVDITGTVVEHARARKILVGKFIPRKGHKTINGHRQWYTTIKIEKIEIAEKTSNSVEQPNEWNADSMQSLKHK